MKLRTDMKADTVSDNHNEIWNTRVSVRAGTIAHRAEESCVEISARRSAVKQLCDLTGVLAATISTGMATPTFFGKTQRSGADLLSLRASHD